MLDHVETAELLGVTPTTIRRYTQAGKLQGKQFAGRWYYTEEHIREFISTPDPMKPRKTRENSTSGNDNLRK